MAKKKAAGAAKKKVHKVMSEYKHGSLKSAGKKKVKSRKQAVAIALSEARASGGKIPKKKSSATKKKSAAKKSAVKKSPATKKKATKKKS